MNPLVKLLHMIQWAVIILMMIPLMILGAFVVIPLALLFKVNMKKLPLWGNAEEDTPGWFLAKAAASWYRKPWPNWFWYAVRNPLNNMRFLFDDTGDFNTDGWQQDSMEAHDLIKAGLQSVSRWRWRGAMAGYRRVWLNDTETYGEFWIGWKVGSTVPGLGFATQYRPRAQIGQ